ncbi:MAG: sterol desaturase family protein [Burkholderiales bacterium]|nr:sterol desaturase family protein [Burkholderiales bacterium]
MQNGMGMGLLSLEHGRTAYRADFFVYGAVVAGLAAALLWRGPRGSGLADLGWIVTGLWLWTLLEYGLHRFVLHGPQPFRRWHGEHHARPSALIGLPTLFSASLFAVLVYAPAWLIGGGWRASALTLGVLLGYLGYAYMHHAVHHWPARSAWMLERKRWHAHHHHAKTDPQCFGVTVSFWDRVFGSGPRAR